MSITIDTLRTKHLVLYIPLLLKENGEAFLMYYPNAKFAKMEIKVPKLVVTKFTPNALIEQADRGRKLHLIRFAGHNNLRGGDTLELIEQQDALMNLINSFWKNEVNAEAVTELKSLGLTCDLTSFAYLELGTHFDAKEDFKYSVIKIKTR